MEDYIELHTPEETILLHKTNLVIIKKPQGLLQAGTTTGTWRWVIKETYEEIKQKLGQC
jgi:hypothetical protein